MTYVYIEKGSGATKVNGPEDIVDVAYFRILSYYRPTEDSLVANLSVRRDGPDPRQANGVLYGWRKQADQTLQTKTGPFLVPEKGVESGLAIMADRKTLAGILRELAQELEAN